jgi:excisionase family DNA binding protein
MDNLVILKKEDLENLLKQVASNVEVEIKEPARKSAMNMDEAVSYMNDSGYPISKSTIYKHTMSGTIPFRRFGGRKIVFRVDDLDKWINDRLLGKNNDVVKKVAASARRKGA